MGSPLDLSSVVADTHVPEHDAAISSCGSKEVALTPCSFGCLSSLQHKSCEPSQAAAVMRGKDCPHEPQIYWAKARLSAANNGQC